MLPQPAGSCGDSGWTLCAATWAANTPVSPIYNPRSGRLEQIVSDRNGDGIVDTRAFMDGPTLQRIELDRNGDSRPDRWEYYRKVELAGAACQSRSSVRKKPTPATSGSHDANSTQRGLSAGSRRIPMPTVASTSGSTSITSCWPASSWT